MKISCSFHIFFSDVPDLEKLSRCKSDHLTSNCSMNKTVEEMKKNTYGINRAYPKI